MMTISLLIFPDPKRFDSLREGCASLRRALCGASGAPEVDGDKEAAQVVISPVSGGMGGWVEGDVAEVVGGGAGVVEPNSV